MSDRNISACPHVVPKCKDDFPCPFGTKEKCHVADGFYADNLRTQATAQTFSATPWTISAMIKKESENA